MSRPEHDATETSSQLLRNIGPDIIGALKRRAARHGRSAEAELRVILRNALREDMERGAFKSLLASMPEVGADEDFRIERDIAESADEIRATRDALDDVADRR